MRVGPSLNSITRNLVLCNWKCTWPLDHDDGSNNYVDSQNALFFGGAKNFKGHSKRSFGNLYYQPDNQLYEGSGPGVHVPNCANNDGASRNSSGWGEVYAGNRCILAGTSGSILYRYDNCDPA